jgi:hypothetical protein
MGACLVWALGGGFARADRAVEDLIACDRAAAQAERDWQLPKGLLGAIGTVESFRPGSGARAATVWPWTINSDGQSFYLSSKVAAVRVARLLLDHGARYVDVGCFQVDLFYHPGVFVSLDEAFDPDANARAAAGILGIARASGASWNDAIARYHSATPQLGGPYAQRVMAAWNWASRREGWAEWVARLGPAPPPAVLLSPQAQTVRVVTPFAATSATATATSVVASPGGQPADAVDAAGPLPRVVNPGEPGAPRVPLRARSDWVALFDSGAAAMQTPSASIR